MELLIVRGALQRLTQQRPFLSGIRFNADHAEISYWDEADTLVDAASLALRLWNEHRESAKLPTWEVVAPRGRRARASASAASQYDAHRAGAAAPSPSEGPAGP